MLNPPKNYKGSVLDGRDIGTIVFPNAKFKFYLDADIRIRAERRTEELIHLNYKVIYHEVLEDLVIRDERDKNRNSAPLRKANDAIFIDTSFSSFFSKAALIKFKSLIFLFSKISAGIFLFS